MANIGYLQVVRHCNHFCGFCSNPTSAYAHDFESMRTLVDDLVRRQYYGVILTGGEPTLHPDLPRITRYARDQGLHVRMITNGHRLAEDDFARDMADAGLQHVHVSTYSIYPEIEEQLRGVPKTLDRCYAAMANAHKYGMTVDLNQVICKQNADHLDANIRHMIEHFPFIRHVVWNNMDPSMGRAEVNQAEFTPRLRDFEASLYRACALLHRTGRTFRVEKVPLCYMTEFAWASTETRKIVKGEERIVHFLDDTQGVRQTHWGHLYADACKVCSVRSICGGLFDRGNGYDPAELSPVFVSRDAIVARILSDETDHAAKPKSLATWKREFDTRLADVMAPGHTPGEPPRIVDGPSVGKITEQTVQFAAKKRRSEARLLQKLGIAQERAAQGQGLQAEVSGLAKSEPAQP